MSCPTTKERRAIKKGSGVPTVPVSADHQDGSWISTDIYEGELYIDTDTGYLYIRNGAAIIGLYVGVPPTGSRDTINITDSTYTMGPSENIFVNNNGGPVKLNLPPATNLSEFTVIKIDPSANQYTVFADGTDTINGSASVSSTRQHESLTFISDGATAWYIK